MTGFDRLSSLLAAPGGDDRPDLYSAFADGHQCEEDMIASDWSWPSFAAGALCGVLAGVVLIGVPAIILAAILR